MSIDPSSKQELALNFGGRALFGEPLSSYVAYRIGGPADVLVFPRSEEELIWLGEFSKRRSLPIVVLGTGTNLLVHDDGIRGITVILRDGLDKIEIIEKGVNGVVVKAGGGVLKDTLLKWACEKEFSGLEFSSGVPGTIGGGIFMNAGTQYGSYGDILTELRLFKFGSGISVFKREELHFGYREQDAVKDAIVLSATFKLGIGHGPTIQAEINRIIAERAEKQPLDYPSCGSTFKNPPGKSAGRLIERSGIKGLRIGGAEISEKHANFILNKGNAKASDVLTLIDIATVIVRQKFGVLLEPEVISLGGPEAQ